MKSTLAKITTFIVIIIGSISLYRVNADDPKMENIKPKTVSKVKKASSARRQGAITKIADATPPAKKITSMVFTNDTGAINGTPCIEGASVFPLRLNAADSRIGRDRKLIVFIALYLRKSPDQLKAGEMVGTYKCDETMIAKSNETKKIDFSMDIPLQKGQYVAYVFLCDPDQSYDLNSHIDKKFPAPEKFPGRVKSGQRCMINVN